MTEYEKGFLCGYTCALTNHMRDNNVDRNGVDENMRSMWVANRHSIANLKKAGVDNQDIAILKKHWKALNK